MRILALPVEGSFALYIAIFNYDFPQQCLYCSQQICITLASYVRKMSG